MKSLLPHLEKLSEFLERVETLLPPKESKPDFAAFSAFRWKRAPYSPFGYLEGIAHPAKMHFSQLKGIEEQINVVYQNTAQFIHGFPANNLLLTGARGTGKSSLIKATLAEFAPKGLKMVEIDSDHLEDLPELLQILEEANYPFIIFCDDLSFESQDASYKPLKAMLDGSLSSPAKNILIYATSNRRHLIPEYMNENLAQYEQREIHAQEAVEEKISLSERFGLWVSFYPYSQQEYLTIVKGWLKEFAPELQYTDKIEKEALQFALQRGSRSGRIAYQFVKNYVGSQALMQLSKTQ